MICNLFYNLLSVWYGQYITIDRIFVSCKLRNIALYCLSIANSSPCHLNDKTLFIWMIRCPEKNRRSTKSLTVYCSPLHLSYPANTLSYKTVPFIKLYYCYCILKIELEYSFKKDVLYHKFKCMGNLWNVNIRLMPRVVFSTLYQLFLPINVKRSVHFLAILGSKAFTIHTTE